jgi:hypothetical protein
MERREANRKIKGDGMTLTEQALNVIADMTVRMCELRVDGQVAHDHDGAPGLFRALLEAYQAAGDVSAIQGVPVSALKQAAPIPICDWCGKTQPVLGGVDYGPPRRVADPETGAILPLPHCAKLHVCVECWEKKMDAWDDMNGAPLTDWRMRLVDQAAAALSMDADTATATPPPAAQTCGTCRHWKQPPGALITGKCTLDGSLHGKTQGVFSCLKWAAKDCAKRG